MNFSGMQWNALIDTINNILDDWPDPRLRPSAMPGAQQSAVDHGGRLHARGRFRETGSMAAKPMGGCRPKKIVGQHRDWLLERCRRQDFTLRGLVGELAERGLQVDYRTVWDFVHSEKLTYKKRRWSPASATGRM